MYGTIMWRYWDAFTEIRDIPVYASIFRVEAAAAGSS
jgi:hypothetical protein